MHGNTKVKLTTLHSRLVRNVDLLVRIVDLLKENFLEICAHNSWGLNTYILWIVYKMCTVMSWTRRDSCSKDRQRTRCIEWTCALILQDIETFDLEDFKYNSVNITAFRLVDVENARVMETLDQMERFQPIGHAILNRSGVIQVSICDNKYLATNRKQKVIFIKVLYYSSRQLAFSNYPDWGFPVLSPHL